MMNRLTINSYCWLFLLLLNTVWLQAQTNLPINQTTTISTLTSNDFQIPVGIESLTVEVRGADGGHARLDGGTCDVRVRGGQGATMKATFAIGNGSNELRPGGLLRVFAGRAGQTDESGCAPIPVGRYGAGGGSSAILYQAPGETSTRWGLLAVAGGGGGGARTAAGITDRTGKGGQAVEDGGDTSGSAGGKNGNCGSSSDNGYGGAGINCLGSDEKGYRMVEAVFGGSNGFAVELKDNSFATETGGTTGIQPIGGDGFTGGAVGAGGGGGGGGFSGGAGSSTWQGGGGGSYIAPNFTSTEVERLAGNQGGATNFPSQGFVRVTANSNCPIGEVLLTSQQAVNDFATNFPNCTEITGDLTIAGDDIVDVSPLSNLTAVQGNVNFNSCLALASLAGLSNLTAVQGNVNFNNCIALPSLAGLSNLQTIGGELILGFNDVLTDLDGLSSLTSVGSFVRILFNSSLLNVNGLSNLSAIGGDLVIGDNPSLTNLDGVCPVIAAGGITGDISIGGNGAPFSPADCICPAGEIQLNSQADVNNFLVNYPNCTQIPGQLVISGPDITDLSPLANITSIEGYLIIGFNATLADLQGLSNLQSVGGNFTVGINPALPSLNGLSALNSVGGTLTVGLIPNLNNLQGLNNLQFVGGSLVLSELSAIQNLDALSNLNTVEGDLIVTNNGLLADFSGICPLISTGTIGGNQTFASNAAEFVAGDCFCPAGDIELTSQAAVESFAATYPNCKNLPGNLNIRGREVLDLSPLSQLETIAGNLEIFDVGSTAFAFTNLVSIGGNLRIVAHSFIPILDGLSKLKTIGGSFVYSDNRDGFVGSDDAALAGLNNLESVGGEFRIHESEMKSIIGFEKLTRIGGIFSIQNNPNLEIINAFGQLSEIGTDFWINETPLLSSFNALSNLRQLRDVTIMDTQLPDLQVLSGLEGVEVLLITDNPAMSSMRGLENLSSVEAIAIGRNNSLANIDAFSNLTTIASTNSGSTGVFLSSNPLLTNLNGLSGLTGTVGDIFIAGHDALVDIDALSNISAITGSLDIKLNPNLTQLDGLRGLRSVGENISIEVNAALSNFEGICPLVSEGTIGGTLTITNNAAEFDPAVDCACFVDATPPVAQCKDIIVNLDANGQASVLPTDLDDGSFDDCGEVVVSFPNGVQQFDFGCDDVLTASIVIVEVTNAKGLSSTCFSEIGITEDIAPVVSCKDITVELNANGLGSYSADMLDAGIVDNCDLGVNGFPEIPVTCAEVGTFPVTYTVKDKAGNEGSCTGNVTVVDVTAPTAICKNLEVSLDANGQASVTPADLDGGSSDACGSVDFMFADGSPALNFNCQAVNSTVTVDLGVADESGNTGICSSQITIKDDIAPVITCEDITLSLAANGRVTVAPDVFNLQLSDNCGITGVSGPVYGATCEDVGTTTPVIVTARDASGNEGTCTVNVTIEDNLAPTALCKDIEVSLDENGLGTIMPADIDDGSFDNCGTPNLVLDQTTFTTAQLGENTVSLTATDASGNSSTCTSTVRVKVSTTLIAYVWDDQDGDGKQDANEPALAEAAVEIIDDATGVVLQAVETNVEGEAIFDVSEIDPSQRVKLKFYEKANHRFTLKDKGSNDNIDSDASRTNGLTAAFNLPIGERIEKWDCGLWAPGTIQSFVWDDQDGDGKQDNGEPGFSGAQVDLLESDGTLLATTTTDENGLANFSQVPADRPVKLKFYTLPNLSFTLKDRGSNNNIDSDASRTNGMTATFQANKGSQSFESWDAGMWSTGTVQAYVWDDQDGDGKQDGGEPAIAGVRVDLLESDGAFIETAQTDALGIATFTGIPTNRRVKLQFFEKDDHRFTLKDRGSNDNIDSDASRTNGMTATFQPSMGNQTIQKWDAGLWSPGQVKAYVWDDQDGDGKQDAAEPAVEGVEVKLLESDGALLATGQTDASGIVTFTDVPADRPVKLQFIEKTDHRFTLKDQGSNNNIDSDASRTNGMTATFQASKGNQTTESWDAGLWSPGQVEAYVWDDRDGDGKQDAGEPGIKGVSVHLLESDGTLVQTGTTGDGGLVNFDNVPANRPFKLQFFTLAGFEFTLKDRGSNNNIDSDASRSNGMTATFQASTGNQTFRSWDAGLWSPGTVEAYVWDDLDGDGKQDEGEPAIANAKVDLLESDGTFMQTTTTDENGLATFGGVPADRAVKLQFFEPIDHRFTLKDKGSNDNIDSDASRSNGMTGTFQASQGAQVHTKMDCGLWSPGEVEAFVWNDLDGDGKQDEGEPGIEGVFVDLLESNNDLLVSTATDADGIATILDVPANRAVKLQFTAPAGYSITLKDKGSNDNIDSDASRSNGRTATFQATMGQQLFVKWDAGLVEEGTSGARVVQEQLETPTAPVAVEEDLELEGAGLSLTAFPNPFSEQLTLEFYTSKAGPARIDVFNLQGQLVRNLYNGQLDAGQHQVQRWDGTGANAKPLPAGMYLIQMKTGEEIVNQKVLLQR